MRRHCQRFLTCLSGAQRRRGRALHVGMLGGLRLLMIEVFDSDIELRKAAVFLSRPRAKGCSAAKQPEKLRRIDHPDSPMIF